MTNSEAERKTAILESAMLAFSRYGFQRTKMDDIAKASGVARTAIYKVYRNKEHIFCALAERVHSDALNAAKAVLSQDGDLKDRLSDALIARDTLLLQIGHSGPHADEIAELYLSLAGELAAAFNAKLVNALTEAIQTACAAESYQLPSAYRSPRDLAHLLRLALEGVKKEVKQANEFERLARQLISAMIN